MMRVTIIAILGPIAFLMSGCVHSPTVEERYIQLVKFNALAVLSSCQFEQALGGISSVGIERCDAKMEFSRQLLLDKNPSEVVK